MMTARTSRLHGFGQRIRSMTETFGGVTACAAAAEAGKRPSRAALKAIGIEPDDYFNIRT